MRKFVVVVFSMVFVGSEINMDAYKYLQNIYRMIKSIKQKYLKGKGYSILDYKRRTRKKILARLASPKIFLPKHYIIYTTLLKKRDNNSEQQQARASSHFTSRISKRGNTGLLRYVSADFEAFTKYFIKKVFITHRFHNKSEQWDITRSQQLTEKVFIDGVKNGYEELKRRYEILCVNKWEDFSFTAKAYDKENDKLYDIRIEKEPFSCINFKKADKNGFCYIACKTLTILGIQLEKLKNIKAIEEIVAHYKLIVSIVDNLILLSDIKEYHQRQVIYMCKNIITHASERGILVNLLKVIFNYAFPFIQSAYEKILSYKEYNDCITISTLTTTEQINSSPQRENIVKMIIYRIILQSIYENELQFNDVEVVLEYYNLLGTICNHQEKKCKELTFVTDKIINDKTSLYSFAINISPLLANMPSLPFLTHNNKVNIALNDFYCGDATVIKEIEKEYNKDGRNFANDWNYFNSFLNTDNKSIEQAAESFLETIKLFLEEGALQKWYIKPFGYFDKSLPVLSGTQLYIPASFSFDNINPNTPYDTLVTMDGYIALLLWYEKMSGSIGGKEEIYNKLDSFIGGLVKRVRNWRQSISEFLLERTKLLERFNHYLVENCLKNFSKECMCISYLYKQESTEIMFLAEKLNFTNIISITKSLDSKVRYIHLFPLRNPFLSFLSDFHINLFNLEAIIESKIITFSLIAREFINNPPSASTSSIDTVEFWIKYLAETIDDVTLLIDYLKIDSIFSNGVKCLTSTHAEFVKLYLDYIKCDMRTLLENTITNLSHRIRPHYFMSGNPPHLLIDNIFSFIQFLDKLLYSKVSMNDVDTIFNQKVCANERERSDTTLPSLVDKLLSLKDRNGDINLQILIETAFKTLYDVAVRFFDSLNYSLWIKNKGKYRTLPTVNFRNLVSLKKFFVDLYSDLFDKKLNTQPSYSLDDLKGYFTNKKGIDKLLESNEADIVSAMDSGHNPQINLQEFCPFFKKVFGFSFIDILKK